MKKLLITTCAILGLMLTMNTASFAQEGRIQVGPGLVYGGEPENLGISVDGYYTINEQFRAGAAFTYFFPNDNVDVILKNAIIEVDTHYFSVDLNGNYIFYNEDELMAYGIAGLNIFNTSFDEDIEGLDLDSETELGLNIGAGVEYAVDFGNLFGELKLAGIGGDANQVVLGAGIRFDIQ